MPKKTKRNKQKTIVVKWRCDDCRNSGSTVIELPIAVEWLHSGLEEAHSQSHPYTMCPGHSFEVTGIK